MGAHLEYWNIKKERIIELDWWEQTNLQSLKIVCTPARHASGRILFDKDSTLWTGYALMGPKHRVYFSGDTGLVPGMTEIGQRLGPFDITMIETGQYHKAWPGWHIGPEQAVRAHRMAAGRVLLQMHLGLFTLAYHGWTEPIERVTAAAVRNHITLVTPKPGESIEPDTAPISKRWWPDIPWTTAERDPIISTKVSMEKDATPSHH